MISTINNNSNFLEGKRILIVFWSLELGGAERQGMHLARYFKRIGCDVHVWAHLDSGLVVEQCNEAEIPWKVFHFRWPCRKSSLLRDGFRMVRAFWKLRPDVILPYTSLPNLSCGLTWLLSPAKACIWGQRNVNDLDGHKIVRFAYRKVSAVICNAEHQISYLRETLGKTRAPISVVHNGVELIPAIKTRSQWRIDLGINENTTVATMVANFRPQKDHSTLLHAWNKVLSTIPEGKIKPYLLLAGAPHYSYNTVRQLATELGLDDSVTFLGQVKDISGLLAASDIGVLCSHYEGLPNVILEYMTAGLPVVATDLQGNREALGHDPRQPFYQKGEVKDLVTKLENFLHNQELRKDVGERNRGRATSEFSVNVMCRRTADIIINLLNKSRYHTSSNK